MFKNSVAGTKAMMALYKEGLRSKATLHEEGLAPLLRGDLGLRRHVPVHHATAAGREVGALLDHARGDLGDVGNLGAAQAESIAGALLLGFRTEGKAGVRGKRGKARGGGQHQRGLANNPVQECGHFSPPIMAAQMGGFNAGIMPCSNEL